MTPVKSSSKRAPLYSNLPPNVSAALPVKPKPNTTLDVSANGSSPMDMDLDCDSPFSPGSASGLSDLFEPPNSSPPTSSLPRLFLISVKSLLTYRHPGLGCLGAGQRRRVVQAIQAPGKVLLEVKALLGRPKTRGSPPGSTKPKMVREMLLENTEFSQ